MAPEFHFPRLGEAERAEMMRLFTQHVALAMLATRYGPSAPVRHDNLPASPFQDYLDAHYAPLPASVINAADYRDLIALMREHGSNAIAEFLTDPDRTPGRE